MVIVEISTPEVLPYVRTRGESRRMTKRKPKWLVPLVRSSYYPSKKELQEPIEIDWKNRIIVRHS